VNRIIDEGFILDSIVSENEKIYFTDLDIFKGSFFPFPLLMNDFLDFFFDRFFFNDRKLFNFFFFEFTFRYLSEYLIDFYFDLIVNFGILQSNQFFLVYFGFSIEDLFFSFRSCLFINQKIKKNFLIYFLILLMFLILLRIFSFKKRNFFFERMKRLNVFSIMMNFFISLILLKIFLMLKTKVFQEL
jgi:hypothetical protein